MSRQQVEQQPAWILHTRRYRETSLIAEVFTPGYGRLGLVAKGARSGKSTYKALLQPFRLLRISWVLKGELGTLTGADGTGLPPDLGGRGLACGFYLNELLMRLLVRHDPHPRLFDHYSETLERIVNSDEQATALRIFEKRLLDEIGYGLILDREVDSGAPIQAHLSYYYRPEEGPVALAAGSHVDHAISGETLMALYSDGPFDANQHREARFLLQRVLRRYLGEKPLKSRELLRAYRPSGNS